LSGMATAVLSSMFRWNPGHKGREGGGKGWGENGGKTKIKMTTSLKVRNPYPIRETNSGEKIKPQMKFEMQKEEEEGFEEQGGGRVLKVDERPRLWEGEKVGEREGCQLQS